MLERLWTCTKATIGQTSIPIGFSDSRMTGSSAFQLYQAINSVYDCGRSGATDCEKEETVEVRMGQKPRSIQEGLDDFPEWIIYYGYDASQPIAGEQNIKILHDKSGQPDDLDPNELPGYCPDGVCYSFTHRSGPALLKFENPSRIHKFWLVSPCFANVKVSYDDTSSSVKLMHESEATVPDWSFQKASFCCSKDGRTGWAQNGDFKSNQCQFQEKK